MQNKNKCQRFLKMFYFFKVSINNRFVCFFCCHVGVFPLVCLLQVCHLQSVCDKKSACVRRLQRRQECVLSRLQESVRRREEAWSQKHTHAVRQLQSQLQVTHTPPTGAECQEADQQSDDSLQTENTLRKQKVFM